MDLVPLVKMWQIWPIPHIENSNANLCISIKLISLSNYLHYLYLNILEAEISEFLEEKIVLKG